MSVKKFTHTGIIRGTRVQRGWGLVSLRETKLYWITPSGTRFRKTTGGGTGEWPLYELDLATIKEVPA